MNTDPLNMARLSGPLHAVLRITTALTFVSHGSLKLLGFPASQMPAPPLASLMGVAGLMEIVGGVLVLVGLFTRPIAFLLAGEMAAAYWMAHAPRGPFPVLNMGESAYLFCFVFLWLSAAGAGPWSLDAARGEGKAAA
ncbi:DoxX family protein [Novosphingobium percolationis]|uniref:DoxX family protein n=1 Tax=Novosphingobium percolationis TaxID=2871811 RepID=UPI001CD7108D|nr:DoxX family protein [Novosphingobium percolationis]